MNEPPGITSSPQSFPGKKIVNSWAREQKRAERMRPHRCRLTYTTISRIFGSKGNSGLVSRWRESCSTSLAQRGWEPDADSLLQPLTFSNLDCHPPCLVHCRTPPPPRITLSSLLGESLFPVAYFFLFPGLLPCFQGKTFSSSFHRQGIWKENVLNLWIYKTVFILPSYLEFWVGRNSFRIRKAFLHCLPVFSVATEQATNIRIPHPFSGLSTLWKSVRSLCPQGWGFSQWCVWGKYTFIHCSRHLVGA